MLTAFLCFVLAWTAILFAVYAFAQRAWSRAALDHGLRDEGYTLQSAQIGWSWRHPFTFEDAGGRVVFRVVVLDGEGATRRGWACAGHLGLPEGGRVPFVDVMWDDDPSYEGPDPGIAWRRERQLSVIRRLRIGGHGHAAGHGTHGAPLEVSAPPASGASAGSLLHVVRDVRARGHRRRTA